MKRILIIVTALFTNTAIAQLVNGTPFNYCTLNGDQYNPGTHPEGGLSYYHNMWVTTNEDDALSNSEVIYLRESFLDNYPNHTILSDSTVSYNCHGYSFSVSQGGDICNICWFDEFCRHSFEPIMTPQKGDVAVIREIAQVNGYVLGSIHSSIVVNQDTMISKWGIGCLTKHHKNDVVNIVLGTEYVYTYYRRVINTNDRIHGPATFNGTGTYYFDHNDKASTFSCTWSVEPAAMFQNASGSGTTASLSYATPY